MSASPRICLIGFGEVGQTLATDLLARGRGLSAWDIKFTDPSSGPSTAARSIAVRRGADVRDAVAGAGFVISAVTAGQSLDAAKSVAPHLDRAAFFLDVNSVSPGVKQQVAAVIEPVGGRYIEAAIMSPISPRRIAAPILLGGPHAAAFLPLARELGFEGAEMFSDQLGRASAAKMCRSILVKGMEALLAESMLTARHYGVEASVLESLHNLLRTDHWPTLARYMISRSLVHGRRRAEEMREVARTVADANVQPWMSSACAERQDWAAQHGAAASQETLEAMLDAIRAVQDGDRTRC
jgi:3-hydroxyisobutyrate dehydrogenase-like beta-hydroxyacid dehydrogenase